jgi:hypothetical protein
MAAALAMALLAAPLARADDAGDAVVARRGEVSLTVADVRQLIDTAEPELRQQMQNDPAVLGQKVRDRLLQLVLLHEAQAHQWDQRPEVRFRAEVARQNAIVESFVASQVPDDPAFPSEDQVRAAYDANRSKLVVPRQYHLAQIFIAAPLSGGVQGDADGLRRISDLRQQIVKAHADFAALARKSSDDKPSAANGGELGWLREEAVIPAIRSAIAGLSEGSVSEPVRSAEGWHLIKLLGTRPTAPATLAEAHDTLVRALRQERVAGEARAYIGGLLKADPMQINEIELGKLTGK